MFSNAAGAVNKISNNDSVFFSIFARSSWLFDCLVVHHMLTVVVTVKKYHLDTVAIVFKQSYMKLVVASVRRRTRDPSTTCLT